MFFLIFHSEGLRNSKMQTRQMSGIDLDTAQHSKLSRAADVLCSHNTGHLWSNHPRHAIGKKHACGCYSLCYLFSEELLDHPRSDFLYLKVLTTASYICSNLNYHAAYVAR